MTNHNNLLVSHTHTISNPHSVLFQWHFIKFRCRSRQILEQEEDSLEQTTLLCMDVCMILHIFVWVVACLCVTWKPNRPHTVMFMWQCRGHVHVLWHTQTHTQTNTYTHTHEIWRSGSVLYFAVGSNVSSDNYFLPLIQVKVELLLWYTPLTIAILQKTY